jgi:hypothetical protein
MSYPVKSASIRAPLFNLRIFDDGYFSDSVRNRKIHKEARKLIGLHLRNDADVLHLWCNIALFPLLTTSPSVCVFI